MQSGSPSIAEKDASCQNVVVTSHVITQAVVKMQPRLSRLISDYAVTTNTLRIFPAKSECYFGALQLPICTGEDYRHGIFEELVSMHLALFPSVV